MIMKTLRRFRSSEAHRRNEEGSALVELALSMPMLCLVLLGAAEFARVAYASIEVANAAHAAAIYAASRVRAASDYSVNGTTYSGGIVNAANADAHISCGGNPISVTSVTSTCSCTDTSVTPSSCSDNQTCYNANSGMVTAMTVTTSCSFSPLISTREPGLIGVNGPFTLSGRSIQVVSNQQ